jgi:hypothetical protein
MSKSPHRSFKRITRRDLQRLADIATADFQDLFARKAHSRPYAKRLGLICLCQGAAMHYVDVHRHNGVHDFDLWGFFREIPDRPFPYRRQGQHDFGPSKFGHNPENGDRFVGRQVGVFGRRSLCAERRRQSKPCSVGLKKLAQRAHTSWHRSLLSLSGRARTLVASSGMMANRWTPNSQ